MIAMGKMVTQSVQRIDYLIKQYDALPDDLEIRSHWAKYVCVLISGLLETAVEELCSEYADSRGHENLARFIGKTVARNNKADVKTICETLGRFDGEWQSRVSQVLSDEQKTAVNSVVGMRHGIAHGRGASLSWVTLTTEYYPRVLSTIRDIAESVDTDFAQVL